MNKRQAKKQFKKRYGVNPNQMAIQLTSGLNELTTTVIPRCVEALAAVLDDIVAFLRSDIFREMVVKREWSLKTLELAREHFGIEEVTKNKEGADDAETVHNEQV